MRAAVAGALGLAAVLAGPAAAGAQTGPRPASTWPTFAWEALAGAGPAAPFEEPARAGSLEPPLL
ncbi:MAG TPA: hypothetical protein VFQ22_05645, partial [Longimicrobiales bacterium]|nr:hypothetical protein [Longimicrobiales bacterium]